MAMPRFAGMPRCLLHSTFAEGTSCCIGTRRFNAPCSTHNDVIRPLFHLGGWLTQRTCQPNGGAGTKCSFRCVLLFPASFFFNVRAALRAGPTCTMCDKPRAQCALSEYRLSPFRLFRASFAQVLCTGMQHPLIAAALEFFFSKMFPLYVGTSADMW